MKLSSRRLTLRPVQANDVLSVHLYASDEETTKYMLWGPNTYSDTIKYIENSLELSEAHPRSVYRYAITLKPTGDLIGMIDLILRSNHVGELGYILNKSYWGQGYTTEACHIMLKLAFNDLGLDKVIATCDVSNVGSYRVMEKLGMRRVGKYARYNPKYDVEMEGYLYELDK